MLAVVTLRGEQLASVHLSQESTTSTTEEKCTPQQKSDNSFSNPAHCATKEPNPVLPETREIVWGLGSFLLLVVLIRFVAYPKLSKGTEARAAKIRAGLDDADRARDSIGAEREAYAAKLNAARVEAAAILDAARAEVDTARSERLGALNAELATLRSQAADDLASSRSAALTSMRSTVTDIAVGVAERVVSRPIDRSSQSALVDDYVSKAGLN